MNYDNNNLNNKKIADEYSLEKLFDLVQVGLFEYDVRENKFVFVNNKLVEIFGYKYKEELLKNCKLLEQLCSDSIEKCNENGEIKSLADRYGLEKHIYEKIELVNTDGITNKAIGTVVDLNLLSLMEIDFNKKNEDWERIFNAIDDVIIILDKELKIKRLNKAALQEYDTFTDNPEGVFCNNLYHIGESHCSTCPARATLFDAKPHSQEVEYKSLGKTFLTSSLPILDNDGEFVGVVFIAKNVTEKKKFKIESEHRLRQVMQTDKLKSLGELVADVAHEINNPNSFIVQNISLLDRSWKLFLPIINDYLETKILDDYDKNYYRELADEMVELIDSIQLGSKRIRTVVSNLKSFSKPESSNITPLNINEVITKSLEILESKLRKSFSNVEIELCDELPNTLGNFQKLEQVLINLIVNAEQAIKNSLSSSLKISSKFFNPLNGICIEIRDDGRGMPKDIIPNLFEPFFTTRQNEGGTGLGLSISKEIVEAHSGIIDVKSKENVGSSFRIYLPPMNEKLNEFGSRILYVDSDDSIFNEEIGCFRGDNRQPIKRVSDLSEVNNYLEDHPEIKIVLINYSFERKNLDRLRKISETFPLINLIVFENDDYSNGENIIRDGIKIVSARDKKELISKINYLISSYS